MRYGALEPLTQVLLFRTWSRLLKRNVRIVFDSRESYHLAGASPQSRSLFSETFCLTGRAYLNTQRYGLFYCLSTTISPASSRIPSCRPPEHFKRENNECIGTGARKTLHKIKIVVFSRLRVCGAMTRFSSRNTLVWSHNDAFRDENAS